MTGLLLKDLFISKKYLRTMSILILLYAVLFSVIGQGDSSFLSSFILILCAFFIATTFSCDEMAHWDKYALTFPVTRSMVVRAKYMTSILFTLAGAAVASLFTGLSGFFHHKAVDPEMWISIFVLFCLVLFFEALALPLLYRFGPEKGRYLLIGMMVLVVLAFVLADKSGKVQIGDEQLKGIFIALLPAGIILLLFSYDISCCIYKNKEF